MITNGEVPILNVTVPHDHTNKSLVVYTKTEHITLPSGDKAIVSINGLTRAHWPVTDVVVKVNDENDITFKQNQTQNITIRGPLG